MQGSRRSAAAGPQGAPQWPVSGSSAGASDSASPGRCEHSSTSPWGGRTGLPCGVPVGHPGGRLSAPPGGPGSALHGLAFPSTPSLRLNRILIPIASSVPEPPSLRSSRAGQLGRRAVVSTPVVTLPSGRDRFFWDRAQPGGVPFPGQGSRPLPLAFALVASKVDRCIAQSRRLPSIHTAFFWGPAPALSARPLACVLTCRRLQQRSGLASLPRPPLRRSASAFSLICCLPASSRSRSCIRSRFATAVVSAIRPVDISLRR